jgi:hypothetical protein
MLAPFIVPAASSWLRPCAGAEAPASAVLRQAGAAFFAALNRRLPGELASNPGKNPASNREETAFRFDMDQDMPLSC